MSDVDTQITHTLLPQSSVAVYSRDKDTLEAARALPDDWRFARVSLQVDEGDVDIATQAYGEMKSPDLVIIQTDTIDESFVPKLEALAGNCGENTEAVIIGPDNDVYLYRKLIDMGVSDYLVRPVKTDMLAEVIAKTLIAQHGVSESRLVAFIGAKGGVGTSMIAQNCGWAASSALNQKTALIDASGGWSNHPVTMGFEPSTTLREAAKAAENNDEDSLARMLHHASDKFTVLGSGGDVMLEDAIDAAHLEDLIETLMIKYPVLLADLSCAAPPLKKLVISKANKIVLASSCTVSCLRLARSLMMEIKDMRGGELDDLSLVLNMQGFAPSNELSVSDIEKAVEAQIECVIPFDTKKFVGLETEDAHINSDKDAKDIFENKFIPLMQSILRVEAEKQASKAPEKDGILSGFLGKIGSKKTK